MDRMKNNYFTYNLKAIGRMLTPQCLLLDRRGGAFKELWNRKDFDIIIERLNYYNRLEGVTALGSEARELRTLRFCRKRSVYFFDTFEYARFFPQRLKAHFAFGDVNYFLPYPSITKSRPIGQNTPLDTHQSPTNSADSRGESSAKAGGKIETNADSIHAKAQAPATTPFCDYRNSVLLNLEKIRHFTFVRDTVPFEAKIDKLFYRGGIYQEHRVRFFEKYFSHSLCDLGHTGSKEIFKAWQKPKISIRAHLPYKFLLSLEGNDVASNLKWIMSSNSVAVMPTPKFETWFMEGRLQPDFHYIHINDDYSNLEEKLTFHIANPAATREIIRNANAYTAQFFDDTREDTIAFLVLEKYFYRTGQNLNIDEKIRGLL